MYQYLERLSFHGVTGVVLVLIGELNILRDYRCVIYNVCVIKFCRFVFIAGLYSSAPKDLCALPSQCCRMERVSTSGTEHTHIHLYFNERSHLVEYCEDELVKDGLVPSNFYRNVQWYP